MTISFVEPFTLSPAGMQENGASERILPYFTMSVRQQDAENLPSDAASPGMSVSSFVGTWKTLPDAGKGVDISFSAYFTISTGMSAVFATSLLTLPMNRWVVLLPREPMII